MDQSRLLAVAILGAWVAMTVCMWVAASGSFRTVKRVLEGSNPQFTEATKPMTPDQKRVVLRYLTSEINRTYFRAYGWAQLALGALLLGLLLRSAPRSVINLALAGAMLALAAILTLYITPEVVALGRQIDFVPRDPAPPEMPRFRALHGAFAGLDGTKLLAAVFMLGRMILAR